METSLQPGTSLEPTERAKFKRANLETIVSFGGDNFLDVVCRDTVSGHDIRKESTICIKNLSHAHWSIKVTTR